MKPTIAENYPIEVELEAGKKYAWCSCGKSTSQPYCDGAHKDTDFTPMIFTAENTEKRWLCQCKKTKKIPFCDGSHSND